MYVCACERRENLNAIDPLHCSMREDRVKRGGGREREREREKGGDVGERRREGRVV